MQQTNEVASEMANKNTHEQIDLLKARRAEAYGIPSNRFWGKNENGQHLLIFFVGQNSAH
jgi:hypothetical protein